MTPEASRSIERWPPAPISSGMNGPRGFAGSRPSGDAGHYHALQAQLDAITAEPASGSGTVRPREPRRRASAPDAGVPRPRGAAGGRRGRRTDGRPMQLHLRLPSPGLRAVPAAAGRLDDQAERRPPRKRRMGASPDLDRDRRSSRSAGARRGAPRQPDGRDADARPHVEAPVCHRRRDGRSPGASRASVPGFSLAPIPYLSLQVLRPAGGRRRSRQARRAATQRPIERPLVPAKVSGWRSLISTSTVASEPSLIVTRLPMSAARCLPADRDHDQGEPRKKTSC